MRGQKQSTMTMFDELLRLIESSDNQSSIARLTNRCADQSDLMRRQLLKRLAEAQRHLDNFEEDETSKVVRLREALCVKGKMPQLVIERHTGFPHDQISFSIKVWLSVSSVTLWRKVPLRSDDDWWNLYFKMLKDGELVLGNFYELSPMFLKLLEEDLRICQSRGETINREALKRFHYFGRIYELP